ncbi:centriolin-like isoform X2 [Pseudoliparis swirei]|uniref:centriolin-like isoform X2 n=1 Tax=Pseudoliparis swirei TaxID=2059687 RepID=UPI0024BD983A|nr:centriolin-like isoform X2 [Pseudoliparis swirei]
MHCTRSPVMDVDQDRLPSEAALPLADGPCDRMSGRQSELEGRLEDTLSRIATETQEIKELEQQLTDGQILSNECLQKDLDEIIFGLQEYLRGLREQARGSLQKVLRLQNENQSLQLHLEVSEGHCRQLEATSRTQAKSNEHQLRRLNRKLRQLSRSMCDSDQLTVDQLTSTTNQLRALNHMINRHERKHSAPLQSGHTVEETQRPRLKLDRTRTRTRDPGLEAPSLGFLGTQDSGLGLQYLGSPERRQQQDRRPAGEGPWVYAPPTHSDTAASAEWRDSGGGSDRSCRGRMPPPPPPPPPPAAVSLGQTPLVGPAWLICNIPEHTDTGGRCVSERLEEKKKLQLETKQLRQHSVIQVCNEVECVEKTLLKRRAELREADRLLLETQSCIHKVSSSQESAACRLEATQHIRVLQEEVEVLRRRRQEEEQSLRETKEEVRSREQELLQLGNKLQSESDRFSVVLSDLQTSQKRLNIQEEQQEQRLLQWREEHQAAVMRVEEVREEEQRLQRRVKELLSQRREEEIRVTTHRAELKHLLQELLVEQQALEGVKNKRTQRLQQLHKVKEQLDKREEELDKRKEEVDIMRDRGDEKRELNESHRKTELQEVEQVVEKEMEQEELSRRRQERSILQEQCKHLEARRRHAERSLLAVEAELTKQREELSHAQLLQQELVRDVTANQEQLNAAVSGLENRGHCDPSEEEPTYKEEPQPEEEGLVEMKEELRVKEDEIKKTDKEEDSREESEEDESFYLSTDGLRSAFTCEETCEVEMQREELRQQEDHLRARLRCSLRNQEENLKERKLETQESLQGLRDRVDTLDSLFTHTHNDTHTQ